MADPKIEQEQEELIYKGDEIEQNQEAQIKAKIQRDKELSDYKDMLDTPSGRRVLWRLMGKCGTFKPSYEQGSFDKTAFNEGMRYIGNEILKDIEIARPGTYAQMTNEYRSTQVNPNA